KRNDYLQSTDQTVQKELLDTLITDLQDCFGPIGAYEGMDYHQMHCLVNDIIDMVVESETMVTGSYPTFSGDAKIASRSEKLSQSDDLAQAEEPVPSEAIAPESPATEAEKNIQTAQNPQPQAVQSSPRNGPSPAGFIQTPIIITESAQSHVKLIDEGFFERVDNGISSNAATTTSQIRDLHQP